MNIKKIPKEAQTLISASAYINNFTRAIEELVYNSLDAECTSIAIRVSIQENFIEILDNGIGVNKENFGLLGQKYATSKHIDVITLKSAPDKYGYRGLSLASIIEISQDVLISSRYHESGGTWLKTFHNGTNKESCIAPARPSKGTTIEIRGFLYNLNIQRKSIDDVHELQNIKSSLEQLSLIHCNVSVSLRDDYKNEIIFKIHKKRDIYQTLWSLFEINSEDVGELQVEKSQYRVKAFIGKGDAGNQNQWIYLNGKFVSKTEIHTKVNKMLNKLLFKHKKIIKIKNKNNDDYPKSGLPFYFIFISCPFYDFDIIYKNKRTLVEFKDWTEIDKIIEKLILFYCGESNLKVAVVEKKTKIENTRIQVKEIIEKILNNNVKQPSGRRGVAGKNIKRKNKNKIIQMHNDIPLKCQKLINNFKVLNLKKKGEVQNIILNIKKKHDAEKKLVKPSVKDINKMKYKNNTSSKQLKRIRDGDCIINKFRAPTASVARRCARLSRRARGGALVTHSAADTSYTGDGLGNNNLVKPKTSLDLIRPFDASGAGPSPAFPRARPRLHPAGTSHSRDHQNNSEIHSNKRFISTSSCDNFFLRNKNCTILQDNLHKTKKSLFNDIYLGSNITMKQVSRRNNVNTSDETTDVRNTHSRHCGHRDYQSDNIHDISDIRDRQSTVQSDFGKTYDIDDVQNKTYSVHLSNNFSVYRSIELSSADDEATVAEHNMEYAQSNAPAPRVAEAPSDVKSLLSGSLDPVNYCEIVFKSNEMGDIAKELTNNFTSNREKDDSFDYEIFEGGNNEILVEKLLKSTQNKECGTKDTNMNLRSNKIDLTKLKILTQNNFPRDVNTFQLKKRHEFMPKGMSQIYKTRIRKYDNLSSTKIDYYETTVYNNFADDVLVNSEIFSPMLQNVDVKSKKFEKTNHRDDSNLIFTSSSLREAKVFGQIDRKFIATQIKGIASDSSLDFLVLFDQHAVDERIRLETNLADYFDGDMWSSVTLASVPLTLDKHDLLYLHNHKLKFIQFGLQWAFLEDRILVNAIPKAILGKNPRQEDVVLKAVRRLILEEIDVIKSLGGNVTLYPRAIMDLVFSEACRSAVKFGDQLSLSDCAALLGSLSACKTPFQCAHGRPVMAVLIDLPTNIRKYEVNVENIKQFKVRKCM